jgi:hypothetical protein
MRLHRGQLERVERALRIRREHGVTAADFTGPETFDSGPPIPRLAARMHTLRERGLNIVTEGRRNKFAVYVLRVEARVEAPAPLAPSTSAPAQIALGTPRSAILGPEDTE